MNDYLAAGLRGLAIGAGLTLGTVVYAAIQRNKTNKVFTSNCDKIAEEKAKVEKRHGPIVDITIEGETPVSDGAVQLGDYALRNPLRFKKS